MTLIRKLIGPKSKYDENIPYTYEARVNIIEDKNEYNSYIADKICALVMHLEENNIKPTEVEIYEIFKKQEKLLNIEYCLSDKGEWRTRKELCESFKNHYASHIHDTGCDFDDRDNIVAGP